MPKKEKKNNRFVVLVDKREKIPYCFSNIKPKPKIEYATLSEGDYSIKGFQHAGISIERKEKSDLFGSVGGGRKRFQKEFQRLSKFDYAALVIECSLGDIFLKPPSHSQMKPKIVLRTLLSWSIRYGVHVWACPDRNFAERLTYLLLKRYYDLKMEKI